MAFWYLDFMTTQTCTHGHPRYRATNEKIFTHKATQAWEHQVQEKYRELQKLFKTVNSPCSQPEPAGPD